MATTKSSRPTRKKSAAPRSAAAPARRRSSTVARKAKPAARRATAASAASHPENPPLSPAARKALALLKARGEKIVSRLVASLAANKPAAKRKTARGPRK